MSPVVLVVFCIGAYTPPFPGEVHPLAVGHPLGSEPGRDDPARVRAV